MSSAKGAQGAGGGGEGGGWGVGKDACKNAIVLFVFHPPESCKNPGWSEFQTNESQKP